MSALQIAGTLLAIPVGLASAYSVYRTSFSPEAACRTLRANIVVMLDKNVDLTTRRMLVRRDIEAFDQSCADVDPDAKTAFSALLSADKAAAPVAVAPRAEPQQKEAVRKIEPRADVPAKRALESTASVSAGPQQGERDAAASDAAWLAAVRHALVTGAADRKVPATAAKSAAVPLTPTGIRPISPEVRTVTGAPPQVLMPPASAPALPPPIAVTSAAAPKSDPDHPVPPAPIPEMTSSSNDADTPSVEEHPRSRFRQWVARRLRFWDNH
jgi:hypothetical protein